MRLGIMTDLGAKTPEEWARKHIELGSAAVTFPLFVEGNN